MEHALRLTRTLFQIQFTSVFVKRGSRGLAALKTADALWTCHLKKRALVMVPVSHKNATAMKASREVSAIYEAAQMTAPAMVHATQHTQVPAIAVLIMEVRTVRRS